MAYCNWRTENPVLQDYHDKEWGIPVHDDRRQFEYLMMEVMQCGLNWNMMLQKREIFRQCFAAFDFDQVAAFEEPDIARILAVPGMIRSRRKIEAVIQNARCFQEIRRESGTFSAYIWSFSGNRTILYTGHEKGLIPASNRLSDTISADLKKRGFKYLGSITVYSHLQACGIINDHDQNCPCRARINEAFPTVRKRCWGEKDVRDFRRR